MDEAKQEPFERVYELCDELGSGQYAVVSLCRKRANGDKFAAKRIQKSGGVASNNGVDLACIHNEVAILRLLHHQHVVQLFEVFDSRKYVTMVLEYVEGGELFDFLADKDRLDEDEASGFVHQLLVGVAYMHEHFVVHLDLKPENIMLEQHSENQEQRIKIIDFGLAQRCEAGRAISVEPHGTPEFISPEVLACEPVALSADMWTLGVIVHVMLTGCSPFAGKNDAATFRKILAAQYDLQGEELSEAAKKLIGELLLRKPEQRLTAQQALQHVWFNPEDEQHALQRKRSVIRKENLQRLKQYVSAKQRWKKTVELISLVNRLSHMANYRRSSSHFELSRVAASPLAQSDTPTLPQQPTVKLSMPTPPQSPNKLPGSEASASPVSSPLGLGLRQLKPISAAGRTLSGSGITALAQQRATSNNTLVSLRALLKPIDKTPPTKND